MRVSPYTFLANTLARNYTTIANILAELIHWMTALSQSTRLNSYWLGSADTLGQSHPIHWLISANVLANSQPIFWWSGHADGNDLTETSVFKRSHVQAQCDAGGGRGG